MGSDPIGDDDVQYIQQWEYKGRTLNHSWCGGNGSSVNYVNPQTAATYLCTQTQQLQRYGPESSSHHAGVVYTFFFPLVLGEIHLLQAEQKNNVGWWVG